MGDYRVPIGGETPLIWGNRHVTGGKKLPIGGYESLIGGERLPLWRAETSYWR